MQIVTISIFDAAAVAATAAILRRGSIDRSGTNGHRRSRRDCGNLEAATVSLAKQYYTEQGRSRRDCGNLEAGHTCFAICQGSSRSRRDCGNLEAGAMSGSVPCSDAAVAATPAILRRVHENDLPRPVLPAAVAAIPGG